MASELGVDVGSAPVAGRHRLGVDFGTSHTVAVLCWPDGRTRPLLFDGTPQLSSAVFAAVDGRLRSGRAVLRRRSMGRHGRHAGRPVKVCSDGLVQGMLGTLVESGR
jgi:hypothetical protein